MEVKKNLKNFNVEGVDKYYHGYYIDYYTILNSDKKITDENEKVATALREFDCYNFALIIEDKIIELLDNEDLTEKDIEKMLYNYLDNNINYQGHQAINKCILELYDNGDIIQINNVLLQLSDGGGDGSPFVYFNNFNTKEDFFKELYILDMYLDIGFDVSIDLNAFNFEQIYQIYQGFLSNIDISKYTNTKYTAEEMEIIREELEDWDIDISKYIGVGYSDEQLEEIKDGLECGIDVNRYASIELDAKKMCKIKEQLQEEKWQKRKLKK